MNCNPCCGCCPPITTYNPSVADNFPTILQQVEYLKALLKKYPSQQWFITQEKVTEETVKLDSTKIPLRGRVIETGDFVLGNTVDGTILIFQYTGVMIETTYYAVQYVGIYSSQILAEQAEANAQEALQRANGANELAGQALSLAQTNEKDIGVLDGQVAQMGKDIADLQNEASLEITLTPATATSGTLTDEQYATLELNDNCYIKLNDIVYTLSKRNPTQGYSVYSTGYLSDTKAVQTITITNLTKGWVMTKANISGNLYYYNIWFSNDKTNQQSGFTFSFISSSPKIKADITPSFVVNKCNTFFNGRTGAIIYPESTEAVKFCILSTHSYTSFIDVIFSDGTSSYLINYNDEGEQQFADNYSVADLVEVRI